MAPFLLIIGAVALPIVIFVADVFFYRQHRSSCRTCGFHKNPKGAQVCSNCGAML